MVTTARDIRSIWEECRSKMKENHKGMKIWHPRWGFMLKVRLAIEQHADIKTRMVKLPDGYEEQLYRIDGNLKYHEYDKAEITTAERRIIPMQIISMNAIIEGFIHELCYGAFASSSSSTLWETYHATLTDKSLNIKCKEVHALCECLHNIKGIREDLSSIKKPELISRINKVFVDPDNGELVKNEIIQRLIDFHTKNCAATTPIWRDVCDTIGHLFPKSSKLNAADIMGYILKDERNKGMPLQFRVGNDHFERYNIVIRDWKTLDNFTKLFYGLRCILVHGNPEPTLRNGALAQEAEQVDWNFDVPISSDFTFEDNFPKTTEKELAESEQLVAISVCRMYLTEVWQNARASGCKVVFDYNLYVNVYHFFQHYSFLLRMLVGKYLAAKSPSPSSTKF